MTEHPETSTDGPPRGGFFASTWKPLLALLIVAAAARAIHFLYIRANDPAFDYMLRQLDSWTYDDWALRIVGGDWASRFKPVFYYGPVYPYLLALLYAVVGHSYAAAHAMQFALGLGAVGLVYLAARRWFESPVAFVGALLYAVCAGILFSETPLLPAPLTLLALSGAVWALGGVQRDPEGRWRWVLLGALLGLATLQRANALLVSVAVVGWVWVYWRGSGLRRRAVWTLTMLGAMAAVIAPATLHNRIVGGEWVLVTSNGPNLLYIGNAHDAEGIFVYPESFDRLRPLAERGEVSMTRALVRDVLEHPLGWVGLMLRKFYFFWAAYDVPDNYNLRFHERFSPLLRFNPVRFGWMAALGAVGLVLTRSRWRQLSALYVFMAAYCLSIVLVFIVGRYRLPILVALSPFAGYTLVWAWRAVRGGRYDAVAAAAIAVLVLRGVLGLYVAIPFELRGNDFLAYAKTWEEVGRPERARALLREGEAFFASRRSTTPREEGTRLDALAHIRNQRLRLLFEDRAWDELGKVARAQLQAGVRGPHVYKALAMSRYFRGEAEGAMEALRQGLKQHPADADLQNTLRAVEARPVPPDEGGK